MTATIFPIGSATAQPVISVITVCRNAAATIAATLTSVAAEKTARGSAHPAVTIEYIVVDGLSTDNTVPIIESFAPLVDVLISEGDRGLYDAMNKGAAIARGRYVCFLNADDAYEPGALAALCGRIQTYPEVGVFYGDWVGIDAHGLAVARQASATLGWRYRLCHQAMAVRRDVLGTRPFDERYRVCADFDAILRWLGSATPVMHVPESLVRFSETGMSNTSVGPASRESVDIAVRRLGLQKSWRFCVMTLLHWCRTSLGSFGRFVRVVRRPV